MDIQKALLKENSKKQTIKVVNYIKNDPERFKQLIDLFLTGSPLIRQRAAWSVSYCGENNPSMIIPYLKPILKMLENDDIHDAVKRNTVRVLQFLDIPQKYHGQVVQRCFELMDVKQPIAVRVFSMTVLCRIAQQLPDLKNELQLVIEDQLPYASAGFVSRAKKVLKELKK